MDQISENDVQTSPGQLFEHFITMEDLLDKLKRLNYDKEFVKDLKQKALSRHYFAIQTNPGEQFYTFASLSSWLVRKCSLQFEQPQEYDDPNSTISTILDWARQFGATIDFPPTRLKQGYGEHAIYILNCLTDQALKVNPACNMWQRAESREEASEVAAEVDDDSELLLEKVEEEMAGLSDSPDEEENDEGVLNLEDIRNIQIHRALLQQNRSEEVLQSTVRLEDWQAELERVLPQLRVTVQTDAGDWRTHLELMQKYHSNVNDDLKSAKVLIEKIQVDIKSTWDKIDSREKHLNGQLESLMIEYRDKQDELRAVTEQYRLANAGVTERSKILSRLSEELETVKRATEDRSTSMTDGSPLINAKKAATRLRAELKDLDVRLGVLDSEILQTRLRHKTLDHQEATESFIF